jgi:hypothetical protein
MPALLEIRAFPGTGCGACGRCDLACRFSARHIGAMTGKERAHGPDNRPFFQVALNLPHAGRVARRIVLILPPRGAPDGAEAEARRTAADLLELLAPCMELDENPPGDLGVQVRDRAAVLGRQLVGHIEGGGFGFDRLGQCVRNLFECLELGREGAEISLRAGENPRSLQRPV